MMPPHLGVYAQEKAHQTTEFSRHVREAGFIVDVITRVEDGIVGADWPKFLRKCEFTVGMKGGASIADLYGLLYARVEARRQRRTHHHDTAESVSFLRRRDGRHRFSAFSPRLFEAAAAGACQVLRPDYYLGVLEPWVHYLPLNSDFSNVQEVLLAMRELEQCQAIANNSYEQLIDSGKFSYRRLVDDAVNDLLADSPSAVATTWCEMVTYLRRATQLCEPDTMHLHDAAVHLIHETLSSHHKVGQFAQKQVTNSISQLGCFDWFREQYENARTDSLSLRTPWIWRSLLSVD